VRCRPGNRGSASRDSRSQEALSPADRNLEGRSLAFSRRVRLRTGALATPGCIAGCPAAGSPAEGRAAEGRAAGT